MLQAQLEIIIIHSGKEVNIYHGNLNCFANLLEQTHILVCARCGSIIAFELVTADDEYDF